MIDQEPSKMKVLMLGASRAGKSSILASLMYTLDDIREQSGVTNIQIKPDKNTEVNMRAKRNDLRTTFDEAINNGYYKLNLDDNPDSGERPFTFQVTYSDAGGEERALPDIEFRDIPGEYLTKKEKEDLLKGLIVEANVIMVAIDTPTLMEEDGIYCESWNHQGLISSALTKHIIHGNRMQQKLILFVPLKCEKYYHDDQMEDVNQRVKEVFDVLLKNLKTNCSDSLTIAITPILTMGGIKFWEFEKSLNGVVDVNNFPLVTSEGDLNQFATRPKKAWYVPCGRPAKFSPKFCEQPMLYTLAFLYALTQKEDASLSAEAKQKDGASLMSLLKKGLKIFSTFLLQLFFDVMKKPEYRESWNKLSVYLKREGNGYEILQNPIDL